MLHVINVKSTKYLIIKVNSKILKIYNFINTYYIGYTHFRNAWLSHVQKYTLGTIANVDSYSL